MNEKTLSFSSLCKFMRFIRGMSLGQLGKACATDEQCIRYIEHGLLQQSSVLERRIRQALNMPRATDKLLSMVYYARFNEEAYDNPDPSLATPAPASQPAEQAVPSPQEPVSPIQAPAPQAKPKKQASAAMLQHLEKMREARRAKQAPRVVDPEEPGANGNEPIAIARRTVVG
ncbi:MAG: hypothetical protein ACYC6L_12755 [Anaerolineae bacterium]